MMGSGENIDKVFNVGSMDDCGTRLKFLTELYELWGEGIDIIDRFDKDVPFSAEKRTELEHARKLLYFHMTKDYKDNKDRESVDALPNRAEDITDFNSQK